MTSNPDRQWRAYQPPTLIDNHDGSWRRAYGQVEFRSIDDPAEASDQQYGRREDDETAQRLREFDYGNWTEHLYEGWPQLGDDDPDE